MSFPVYNTVQNPTSTLIIKWSRKGKTTIPDENALVGCFSNPLPKVVSFAAKQGKAILLFESTEIASSITTKCIQKEILYNSTLQLHPSFCKLVEPNEKRTTIPEVQNVSLDGIPYVIHIKEKDDVPFPFVFCDSEWDADEVLLSFNTYLSSHYQTIIIMPFNPLSSISIFLEHNLYDDDFVLTTVCKEGKEWKLTIPHENGINEYHCNKDCYHIQRKTRFCRNVIVSSENEGVVFIATNYRNTPCSCEYHDFCHDRLLSSSNTSKPTQMENDHVYDVYDKIAGHFSSTRYSQWNGVVDFLESLPPYSLVLDMGCGNGKYLTHSNNNHPLIMLGCDRSIELLRICRSHDDEVCLMDGLFMTYRQECFDCVISIAVIHHLSTNALRRRFIINMLNVLKKGGRGLIVAWAMEKDTSGRDTKSNRGYSKADVMVQWQLQKKYSEEEAVYERYYHMFHQGELEWLLNTFDSIRVEKSWYERENWFVSFVKIWIVYYQTLNTRDCNSSFCFWIMI